MGVTGSRGMGEVLACGRVRCMQCSAVRGTGLETNVREAGGAADASQEGGDWRRVRVSQEVTELLGVLVCWSPT